MQAENLRRENNVLQVVSSHNLLYVCCKSCSLVVCLEVAMTHQMLLGNAIWSRSLAISSPINSWGSLNDRIFFCGPYQLKFLWCVKLVLVISVFSLVFAPFSFPLLSPGARQLPHNPHPHPHPHPPTQKRPSPPLFLPPTYTKKSKRKAQPTTLPFFQFSKMELVLRVFYLLNQE